MEKIQMVAVNKIDKQTNDKYIDYKKNVVEKN